MEPQEAEDLWQAVRKWPHDAQEALVRSGAGFETTALFECLLEKSRQEGRDDRSEGIRIAELAIKGLQPLGMLLPEPQQHGLGARGWSRVANAKRLALDFPGAEAALTIAEGHLVTIPNDLLAKAEVLQNRAALRGFQHRFDEALELQDQALPLFRALGKTGLLAQALTLKASLYEYTGDASSGIPSLLEALSVIDDRQDLYLRVAIHQTLTLAYIHARRYREAAELLPRARTLAIELGNRRVASHLVWAEGLLDRASDHDEEAVKKFHQARTAFEQLEDAFHCALVGYDLAVTLSRLNRFSEIVELSTEMLRVFEAFQIPQETAMALRVLQQGISSQEAARSLLEKARSGLDEIRRDPTRQILRR